MGSGTNGTGNVREMGGLFEDGWDGGRMRRQQKVCSPLFGRGMVWLHTMISHECDVV